MYVPILITEHSIGLELFWSIYVTYH